jgi:flagellin
MKINTNPYALNTMRRMTANTGALQQSLQRLSSGLRINGAKDDSAGLAIADRMTTQLRGNSQAMRNIQDGTSLLQTAEGAMSTVNDSLQRVRELAIQAANATNSSSDRRALQAEVDQLLSEVDRIGTTTAFNGRQIFSQVEASISGDANQRAVMDGLMLGWLENSETRIREFYGISGDGANIDIQVREFTDGAGGTAAQVVGSFAGYTGKGSNLKLQVDMADFTPPNLPNGGTAPQYNDRVILHEMVHAVMYRSMNMGSLFNANDALSSRWFAEGMSEFIHGADERLAGDIANAGGGDAGITAVVQNIADGSGTKTWSLDSAHYSSGYAAVRYLHEKLKDTGAEGIKDFMVHLNENQDQAGLDSAFDHFFGTGTGNAAYDEADFLVEFRTEGLDFIKNQINLTNTDTGAVGGLDADGGISYSAESIITMNGTRVGDDALTGFKANFEKIGLGVSGYNNLEFQVGYQAYQTINTQVGAMNTTALGLGNIDIANAPSAALLRVDDALTYVRSMRGEIGAQLSRFDAANRSLQATNVDISAARSRTMDADYAQETAGLVRNQILQQSATAMLVQAKAVPQIALQLLRG